MSGPSINELPVTMAPCLTVPVTQHVQLPYLLDAWGSHCHLGVHAISQAQQQSSQIIQGCSTTIAPATTVPTPGTPNVSSMMNSAGSAAFWCQLVR